LKSKVERVTLEIELNAEKKIVSSLLASLSPEAIESKRLSFSVEQKTNGKVLLLSFSGSDLVSVRAGMNTILRLLLSALNSIQAVEDIEKG